MEFSMWCHVDAQKLLDFRAIWIWDFQIRNAQSIMITNEERSETCPRQPGLQVHEKMGTSEETPLPPVESSRHPSPTPCQLRDMRAWEEVLGPLVHQVGLLLDQDSTVLLSARGPSWPLSRPDPEMLQNSP